MPCYSLRSRYKEELNKCSSWIVRLWTIHPRWLLSEHVQGSQWEEVRDWSQDQHWQVSVIINPSLQLPGAPIQAELHQGRSASRPSLSSPRMSPSIATVMPSPGGNAMMSPTQCVLMFRRLSIARNAPARVQVHFQNSSLICCNIKEFWLEYLSTLRDLEIPLMLSRSGSCPRPALPQSPATSMRGSVQTSRCPGPLTR